MTPGRATTPGRAFATCCCLVLCTTVFNATALLRPRKRLGRRRAKGPPRQQYRFATDVNLWQIGFGRIRCRCLIFQNTFTCNMFSWSRLGDLNPGPTQ